MRTSAGRGPFWGPYTDKYLQLPTFGARLQLLQLPKISQIAATPDSTGCSATPPSFSTAWWNWPQMLELRKSKRQRTGSTLKGKLENGRKGVKWGANKNETEDYGLAWFAVVQGNYCEKVRKCSNVARMEKKR